MAEVGLFDTFGPAIHVTQESVASSFVQPVCGSAGSIRKVYLVLSTFGPMILRAACFCEATGIVNSIDSICTIMHIFSFSVYSMNNEVCKGQVFGDIYKKLVPTLRESAFQIFLLFRWHFFLEWLLSAKQRHRPPPTRQHEWSDAFRGLR